MASDTVRSTSSSITLAETWLAISWSLHPFDPILLASLSNGQASVALIAGRHCG